MYGINYVWIVTSTPDVNSTFDWWVPESSSNSACTREQMEEALDYHFNFYYTNEINGTLVSGKVVFSSTFVMNCSLKNLCFQRGLIWSMIFGQKLVDCFVHEF